MEGPPASSCIRFAAAVAFTASCGRGPNRCCWKRRRNGSIGVVLELGRPGSNRALQPPVPQLDIPPVASPSPPAEAEHAAEGATGESSTEPKLVGKLRPATQVEHNQVLRPPLAQIDAAISCSAGPRGDPLFCGHGQRRRRNCALPPCTCESRPWRWCSAELTPDQRRDIVGPCSSGSIEGLVAVLAAGELIGAAWGQRQPGSTAIFWPPHWTQSVDDDTACRLTCAVTAALDAAGIRMTQMLLADRRASIVPTLESGRF